MPVVLVKGSNSYSGFLSEFHLKALGFSFPAPGLHVDLVEGSRHGFYFLQVHCSGSPLLYPSKDHSGFVSNERAAGA
jgi:hypothetical protein